MVDPDVGVRCKTEPPSQPLQHDHFSLNGFHLTLQPLLGCVERGFEQGPVLLDSGDCEKKVPNDCAAEPGFEELLYPEDALTVLVRVDAVTGSCSSGRKQILFFVVPKRTHAHTAPCREFPDPHAPFSPSHLNVSQGGFVGSAAAEGGSSASTIQPHSRHVPIRLQAWP